MKEVSQKLYQSQQMKHDIKSFTGVVNFKAAKLGWLNKPLFSVKHIIIAAIIVGVIRWLSWHLHIYWT